jgi:hypothetical protein
MITQGAITVKDALSYAMSLPVATTLSGMNSLAILKQSLEVAASFEKLSASQMAGIEQRRCRTGDGHLELFKTTVKYDGKVGRRSTRLPLPKNCPSSLRYPETFRFLPE